MVSTVSCLLRSEGRAGRSTMTVMLNCVSSMCLVADACCSSSSCLAAELDDAQLIQNYDTKAMRPAKCYMTGFVAYVFLDCLLLFVS